MRATCRTLALLLTLAALPAAPAAAEWHVKPFLGLTFGGNTTFVDVEKAVGHPNPVYGVTGVLLGEVFGIEGDVSRAPGFFQRGGQDLLAASSVTTLTGSVVVAVPKRIAKYTLRPYVVAGGGLIHAQIEGRLGALHVNSTHPAVDVGGGATGFFNERVGVSWDLRYFRSISNADQLNGVSFVPERLSFWRASMAVAFRY